MTSTETTERGEARRKLVHVTLGLPIALLPSAGPLRVALAMTCIGALFLVLARSFARPWLRARERATGDVRGIVLYPLVVALMLVALPTAVAAGAWAMLAFADPAASLAGRAWPTERLPWNETKTWAGAAAFAVIGTIGACVAIQHVTDAVDGASLVVIALCAALCAALAESLRGPFDDNLRIPAAASVALLLGLAIAP